MQLLRRLSGADLCSAIVACALVTISVGYLWTDPTYDEAVYLQLARTIAEWGLPLRRVYEDFSEFRLFANSPPLILYVTSISQRVFPGDDVPARLVHIAAFVLPTYVMVWWVARVKFGAAAALASLVAVLTTASYAGYLAHLVEHPAGTDAIEFYSGRPVRAGPFTFPRDLVLRSLEGGSGDDISFVVVDPRAAHRNLDAIRQQWNTLLAEHFELVTVGAPGLEVYQRRVR